MNRRMNRIFRQMLDAGWRPAGSVTEARIAGAESELGVLFPGDYRAFLERAGSTPESEAARWYGLWGIEEVVSLNRTMPVFRWFPGIVGIGNRGFIVYALDYRAGIPPSVVSLGLSSSDPEDIRHEGDSFSEWLVETLPGGWEWV